MEELFVASDNLVTYETPHDAGSGDTIADATMVAKLTDSMTFSEADVISTASMSYDAEDDQYEGVYPGDELADLVEGTRYYTHLFVSGTAVDYRRIEHIAVVRGTC